MIPHRVMIVLIVFCLIGLSRHAQSAEAVEPGAAPYSLSEILALALKHSPVMTGVEAVLEESQGRQMSAGAYLNPTVTGSAGRGAIRDPRTGVSITERTITIEQPLEWPEKRAARQRAAEAGLSGALVGMEEAKV
ncbi:MAG: TolC family protein, partial [Nitrospira sp.]|nr:TolC family protein [Nitrospira sp.]